MLNVFGILMIVQGFIVIAITCYIDTGLIWKGLALAGLSIVIGLVLLIIDRTIRAISKSTLKTNNLDSAQGELRD